MVITSIAELDSWLDANAEDIAILHRGATGAPRTMTLAQLERESPASGQRLRESFRLRWAHDGWLPIRTSDAEKLVRDHPGCDLFYKGPCPHCGARVVITARPGIRCSECRATFLDWTPRGN